MYDINFENIRCFSGKHEAPIKRLTILVGENSSGKTTFLAISRFVRSIFVLQTPNFNEDPFNFGSYKDISTYKAGKGGGTSNYFTMGIWLQTKAAIKLKLNNDETRVHITTRFTNIETMPNLASWEISCNTYSLLIDYSNNPKDPAYTIKVPSGTLTFTSFPLLSLPFQAMSSIFPSLILDAKTDNKMASHFNLKKSEGLDENEIHSFLNVIGSIQIGHSEQLVCFAPIRTEPRRTYETVIPPLSAQGNQMPHILSRLYSETISAHSKEIIDKINSYGQAAGLFQALKIKHLGTSENDPFQIKVKHAGSAFNLVDVGYGVSQSLPIVVDLIRNKNGSIYYLQQPEVHLHPKSQAELGSLILDATAKDNKHVIVETHSEYLVNRIRADIRDKKCNPSNVAILFFEKKLNKIKIHSIQIDDCGNLINPPPGYAKFFLAENDRLLGS